MSQNKQPDPTTMELVVVGASAGGIEALSILVGGLRADFPAPLVIAQHLDPTRPSTLAEILQRRTPLSVKIVEDEIALEPGHIYVVPSNHHVAIRDGHVALEDARPRPKPSVDRLLSSAALAYGERLIAVILSGAGGDGAAGAVDVKNAGGIVIIQDPETARYAGMPLAIPPTVVDFELDVESIGSLLHDLLSEAQRTRTTEGRSDDILRHILDLVSRHASIDFRPYKASTILRRISRRMAVTHHRTMLDYATYLEEHPEEIAELVRAFLINVTQFFRDPEAFTYLRTEVLPLLLAEARERDRTLRLWSAGCATGEEPYSLAMLLADLLGAELSQWSIKIFATDLDEAAINFARRGIYTENLLLDVPPEYRERYFERTEYGYRIAKSLRQMVIFGHQDLSRSAPFPRIDMVSCRNVLIYFTPELQEYVLNQFAFSLGVSHGWLFLGKAETVRPSQPHFELINKQWKLYRCTSMIMSLPRRVGSEPGLRRLPRPERLSLPLDSLNNDMTPASSHSADSGQLRRLLELLLRFLPIGVAVIDRSYRLISANVTARRLLGLRDTMTDVDFLHAVRGLPYTAVRNAIDTVFRERSAFSLTEIELDTNVGGNGRYLTLTIALMQLEAGAPDLAAISVADVTEQVQVRQQLESVQREQERLVGELSIANRRLNDLNKELLDANEELQVTNEEMMLTHEELQAAIEEFEATNEELQATNEELETNNEELQATNEELQTTNDELRARTNELQELTIQLESQRARLAEIVEFAPLYIMVLQGRRLQIEAFNPRYARLLEGRVGQGQPLDTVADLLWGDGPTILAAARLAYEQDAPQVTPRLLTYYPTAKGRPIERYLSYTLVPVHDLAGRVDGVVLYSVDDSSDSPPQDFSP